MRILDQLPEWVIRFKYIGHFEKTYSGQWIRLSVFFAVTSPYTAVYGHMYTVFSLDTVVKPRTWITVKYGDINGPYITVLTAE